MIELERLLETDRLDNDNEGNLDVKYESMLEFMDQQSQAHSNTQPSSSSSSVHAPIYSSTQWNSLGQPNRTSYNEYGNERDDIRSRGKRLHLETIDKNLLLDDDMFLNLTANDPQSCPTVIKMWSQMVARKYNELEIEKTL